MKIKTMKEISAEIDNQQKTHLTNLVSLGLQHELRAMDNIATIIEERVSIVDKSFKATKNEKWIHIGIVLRGIYEEITGNKYDDVFSEVSD